MQLLNGEVNVDVSQFEDVSSWGKRCTNLNKIRSGQVPPSKQLSAFNRFGRIKSEEMNKKGKGDSHIFAISDLIS